MTTINDVRLYSLYLPDRTRYEYDGYTYIHGTDGIHIIPAKVVEGGIIPEPGHMLSSKCHCKPERLLYDNDGIILPVAVFYHCNEEILIA